MAQERDPLGAGPIVGGFQQTSEERLDSEKRQEARSQPADVDSLRLSLPRQVHGRPPVGADAVEELEPRPIEELRIGGGKVQELRLDVAHEDQTLRVGIGERSEEHRAEDAEHRGVGANPERERRDRDENEAGTLAKGANRGAQIGDEGHHDLRP